MSDVDVACGPFQSVVERDGKAADAVQRHDILARSRIVDCDEEGSPGFW